MVYNSRSTSLMGRTISVVLLALATGSLLACNLWRPASDRTFKPETSQAGKDPKAMRTPVHDDTPIATGSPTTKESRNPDLALQPRSPERPTITVLWQVGEQDVHTYHLYYGTERDNLDHRIKLEVSALEKVNDPKLGLVYRYGLEGAPRNKRIYVSLRAENPNGLSAFSPLIEIVPGQWSER